MSPRGPCGAGVLVRQPAVATLRSAGLLVPSHTFLKNWLGPILWHECFRPGLASARSAHSRLVKGDHAQTVDRDCSAATAHPTGWRGDFPTGRPWDFAAATGPPRGGFRPIALPTDAGGPSPSPGPVPRIERFSSGRYQPIRALWVRRAACRRTLSSRCALITGGDSNPLVPLDVLASLVPGGLVAGRRSPPCPPLVASHGCSVAKRPGSVIGNLFLFRRSVSCPTTKASITRNRKNAQKNRSLPRSYPPRGRKSLSSENLSGA
jgi:hypothetical protein